eukprot:TRINITY_DN6866_c0_g1_i2.p2 TRINITY_DN6866_c0_g1~~TRINITY_DN6866_c0_g1_i2.p2  ORF type:complete len:434 (-),score=146.08 TRINITY_DN6866_c0_g1_i2:2685-3986(-)
MRRLLTGLKSRVCTVLGGQWGDEGKGKLVDILARDYDYVCRFNGGANAGHTIIVNRKKYPLHLVPCGIFYEKTTNVLGNGVVVNIPSLFEELGSLQKDNIPLGKLVVSDRAHIVLNIQLEADAHNEGDPKRLKIGTTKKGIGPTYSSKAFRNSVRVGDLKNWEIFKQKYNALNDHYGRTTGIEVDRNAELQALQQYRDRLISQGMIQDTILLMNRALNQDKRILVEGANAVMLDLDFGTYPYVTSSSTTVGGIMTGLGIPPSRIQTTIGIVKAYTTRVGEGPFPSELKNDIGAHLQKKGHEFGATTGRPRRCGWLDLQVVRYSHMINDYSSINLTKLDVLSELDEIRIGVHYKINGQKIDYMPATLDELAQAEVEYITLPGWKKDISNVRRFEDLPKEAQQYVRKVEELAGIPISWIGVGPDRDGMIQTSQDS